MNTRKLYNQIVLIMQKTSLSDQEFVEFKQLVARYQLSLARTTATSFGIAAITVLIAFVYGFVNNAALNKQQESALYYKEKAEKAETQVANMEAEIKASVAAAEAARAEAERLLLASQEKSKGANSKK